MKIRFTTGPFDSLKHRETQAIEQTFNEFADSVPHNFNALHRKIIAYFRWENFPPICSCSDGAPRRMGLDCPPVREQNNNY